MNEEEARIKDIMAKVFGVDAKSIVEASSYETIETWDSLAHMNLLAALEEEFDVQFDEQDIEKMVSFRGIVSVLVKQTTS